MNGTPENSPPRNILVPEKIIKLIRGQEPFTYRDIRKIVGTSYTRKNPLFKGSGFIHVVNKVLDEYVKPKLNDKEKLRLRKVEDIEEADLRNYKKYDQKTGVLTHHYMESELPKYLIKNPKSRVVFIDLDKFKKCNDDFGHSIGDETLNAFGGILNEILSDYGLVSRWGGEEFIAVIPDDVKDLDYRLEEIRKAYKEFYNTNPTFRIKESEFVGTTSIGIYEADFSNSPQPVDMMTVQSTIDKAEVAVYAAKGDKRESWVPEGPGRNRIVIWNNSMPERIVSEK